MNAKSVGKIIANLRRRQNMTQAELALRLNVSHKTISKWESGSGFPEVTQFPALAHIFNVSVDYLMAGGCGGIAVAGTIITDIVKIIDTFPERGMLSNIKTFSRSVGGCVPNTLIDLAKIDNSLPLYAIGKVGDDEYGRYITSQLQHYGIDIKRVLLSDKLPTSFCDVMSVQSTGERTFFNMRGANAEFAPEDINLSELNCDILHMGYILMMDKFDCHDDKYGTVMAHFFNKVQQCGIKTSIDVVSDSGKRFKETIVPVLKYCNYAFMNEIEACGISGLEPRNSDGSINIDNIYKTMKMMIDYGVKDKVIIHCPEAGFCMNADGSFIKTASLNIPSDSIKGTVGAGDAFCAGCLYSIYKGYSDEKMLDFASRAAACCLFASNSVDGIKSYDEMIKQTESFTRITI